MMPKVSLSGSAATKRRSDLREQFAKDKPYWIPRKQSGWFKGPRSLPLLVPVLGTKKISGGRSRLGAVYVELLSRHIDEGIVEMGLPLEHAWAAGFSSRRAERDWREHMRRLVEIGLIEAYPLGNMTYGYVLLVHPAVVVKRLHDQKKLPPGWWDQYRARQIRLGEPTYDNVLD